MAQQNSVQKPSLDRSSSSSEDSLSTSSSASTSSVHLGTSSQCQQSADPLFVFPDLNLASFSGKPELPAKVKTCTKEKTEVYSCSISGDRDYSNCAQPKMSSFKCTDSESPVAEKLKSEARNPSSTGVFTSYVPVVNFEPPSERTFDQSKEITIDELLSKDDSAVMDSNFNQSNILSSNSPPPSSLLHNLGDKSVEESPKTLANDQASLFFPIYWSLRTLLN